MYTLINQEKQQELIVPYSREELLNSQRWFFISDFGHEYHGRIRDLLNRFHYDLPIDLGAALNECLAAGYYRHFLGEFFFAPNRSTLRSDLISPG